VIMLQRSIVGIALVSLLAACGGATTTPTPDVVPTQTRVAEQTQVAVALAPTATVAATSTTASTATPIPATATATPPVATATPRPPISIPPPPPVTLPKVGETAQGKGYTLQVHTVVDPPPAGQYSKPKEGFRWIAFDVTVTNTGTAPLDYNLFYFKVKAADNREYNVTIGNNTPPLGSGKQQPGEAARGWVTVEVPADATMTTLAYDPAFGTNRVQFDIR